MKQSCGNSQALATSIHCTLYSVHIASEQQIESTLLQNREPGLPFDLSLVQ